MKLCEQPIGWIGRTCGALLLAACFTLPARAADNVALVLSEPGGAYSEVAGELARHAPASLRVSAYALADVDKALQDRPAVVVAIGTAACTSVARPASAGTILCLLVPHAAYEPIAAAHGAGAISAIVLDQPLARQLALIRAALPRHRDVGVLLGPRSADMARPLARAAARMGVTVTVQQVTDGDVSAALRSLLGQVDVLLAVPDADIYNTGTTQNILRAAFLANVPMVAFSSGYVRAGALAAIYTTPVQVGRQAAAWLAAHFQGRAMPSPQPPDDFEIGINGLVARSLGLALEDERRIAQRVRQLEGTR